MTDTDTAGAHDPRNDHAATIRSKVIEIGWYTVPRTPQTHGGHDPVHRLQHEVIDAAETLATSNADLRQRIAALEQQVGRLQRNWQTFEHAEGHPATHERWQEHKRAYRDCISHGDFLPRLDSELPGGDQEGDDSE